MGKANTGVLRLAGGDSLSKKIEGLKEIPIEDLGEGVDIHDHNATLFDAFSTIQNGGRLGTLLSPRGDGECENYIRDFVFEELGERTGLGTAYFADLWKTHCAD